MSGEAESHEGFLNKVMQVFENIEEIAHPFENGVVAIGNFDGVHKGHQALFKKVIEKAKLMGGTSIVMTFKPHPTQVLAGKKKSPLITSYERKKELIEQSGMDALVCAPFTKEFASLGAEAFVRDILVGKIGVKSVVVGKDYTFGKEREGDVALLKTYAEKFGFQVETADWIPIPGDAEGKISSTQIRALIAAGNIVDANALLGRNYQVRGTVVKGRNRGGKLLGFPTANIDIQNALCPRIGVYAVCVNVDGKRFFGAANVGVSPTFDDHMFTVEVNILDFDQTIYDRQISVDFVEKIRDEKKFADISSLSDQIKKDVEKARDILSAADGANQ